MQSSLAWKLALENAISVPKTSFLNFLLDEAENKIMLDIDLNQFTGIFFKVDFHNTLLLGGQKYFDIVVSNDNNIMQMTIYYPTGPQILGFNFGLRNILGQDTVSILINADTKDKEITVKTNLFNMKVNVKFPNLKKNVILTIETSFLNSNEKTFSFDIEKHGTILKTSLLTSLIMPRLPLICTETSTCKLFTKFDYEIDYANRVFGVIPMNTVDIQVAKDTTPIVKYHHSTKSSPMLLTVSSPLFLASPLHASLSLGNQNEIGFKIVTNVLVPIQFEVMMHKDMKDAVVEFIVADLHIIQVLASGDMKVVGKIPEMMKYEVTLTLFNEMVNFGKVILNLETTANNEKVLKLTMEPTFLPAINFEIVNVAKHFKFSFMYDLHTPGLPLICNGVATCKWTMLINYEIDFGNTILLVLPTEAFHFNVAKDTNTIVGIDLTFMTNPMLVKFDCPLLLTTPFEVTLQYETVKDYALILNAKIPTLMKTSIPVEYKFNLQKDLKVVEVAFMAYGINFLDVKGTGDVKLVNVVPEKFSYEIEYRIIQGWVAEGKVDINIDLTKVEKLLEFTIAPKTLPSIGVKVMTFIHTDLNFLFAHSLIINNEQVYALEHRNVVEKLNGKWTAVYTDKITLSKDSFIYSLFGKTYLGQILLNLERKVTFEVDLVTPTVFFYNLHLENAFMVEGVKHFAVEFTTIKDVFLLNVFYPVGMNLLGYNMGLQQLIGRDNYKFEITVDTTTNHVTVLPHIWNLKLHMILPEMKRDTMFKIYATYTNKDLTLFDCMVAKKGYVVEAKLSTSLDSTVLPMLQVLAPHNTWTIVFHYELNFNNWMTKVHLPFIMDPLLSVSWNNVELMNN